MNSTLVRLLLTLASIGALVLGLPSFLAPNHSVLNDINAIAYGLVAILGMLIAFNLTKQSAKFIFSSLVVEFLIIDVAAICSFVIGHNANSAFIALGTSLAMFLMLKGSRHIRDAISWFAINS